MSVRRFSNPDQFTITSPELQTVPNGGTVGFLGFKGTAGLGVCCGDTAEVCAYDITPANLTAVTAITFVGNDGANVTVTFASASTAKNIRTAIATALIANGIDPYYQGDEFKGVTVVGNRLRIVGTVVIVSVVVNAVTVNAVVKCDFSTQCVYKFAFEYDTDPTKISSAVTGGTQIGTTGGYAAGATLATIAGDVNTAITGAGFTRASDTVVVENEGAGTYEVTITILGSNSVYYNGASLQSQGCNQTFVA